MKLIKNFKELGAKQFFSQWRKGIEGVTPLQQVKMQIFSTWIILIGIVGGLIICLFNMYELWWLFLILLGALLNTSTTQLGLMQKKKLLSQFDSQLNITEGK